MEIKSIRASVHDTSFGGMTYRYDVKVTMPATEFKKVKDLGNIVLDVGNMVYKLCPNVKSYNPSVDFKQRSKAGVKTIEFTYYDNDHNRAEANGFELLKLKNGECVPKYGQYINLYEVLK
jgi:hypothetical protein